MASYLNSFCAATLLLLTAFHTNKGAQACANGSSAVGDCLHTYLERDFSSIEAIIYAKKRRQNDGVLLLDGPELADQCKRIEEVVECLEDLQPKCHYYNEFFPFRHLVTSLRKSIDWVCAPEHLRSRFRTLLDAFDCLETARQKASSKGQPCFHPHIPVNIWQRIIRLQTGTEVCKALAGHVGCTRDFIRNCSIDAQSVYQELNHLFINAWCTSSQIISNRAETRVFSSVPFLFITLALVFVHQHRLV